MVPNTTLISPRTWFSNQFNPLNWPQLIIPKLHCPAYVKVLKRLNLTDIKI